MRRLHAPVIFCLSAFGCAVTPVDNAQVMGFRPISASPFAQRPTDPGATPYPGAPDLDALPELVTASRAPTGNPWIDCYRRFEPSSDIALDLRRLTAMCAGQAGYVAVTPVHSGRAQAAEGEPERFSFRARHGRCYRAFAIGDSDVEDLDVAIFNADGGLVAGDASDDRWPIVPPREPLCVRSSGAFAIQVAVAKGRGGYLLQIWGSPDEQGDDDDD